MPFSPQQLDQVAQLLKIDLSDGIQMIRAHKIQTMYHPPFNPDFAVLLTDFSPDIDIERLQKTLLNEYPADFAVQLVDWEGEVIISLPVQSLASEMISSATLCLYLPPLGKNTSFQAFQNIIAHLRAPEGCPWDRKQTHQSLRPYLLEEAYEVLEAIDNDDTDNLFAEMGDLMLQIVLHTQIAIDQGEFQMRDVLGYVNEKMIRRHPHVFGDVNVNGDAEQVVVNWEAIKQQEHTEKNIQRKSILDGIPKALPALLVTHKYTAKAAKVGFDWETITGVENKVREEIEEIIAAESDAERIQEIGDLLSTLVNWLRWLGVNDPESLLREVNAKFYRRFRYIEEVIAERGDKLLEEYSLIEMDALWDEAKAKGL